MQGKKQQTIRNFRKSVYFVLASMSHFVGVADDNGEFKLE